MAYTANVVFQARERRKRKEAAASTSSAPDIEERQQNAKPNQEATTAPTSRTTSTEQQQQPLSGNVPKPKIRMTLQEIPPYSAIKSKIEAFALQQFLIVLQKNDVMVLPLLLMWSCLLEPSVSHRKTNTRTCCGKRFNSGNHHAWSCRCPAPTTTNARRRAHCQKEQ